jgi:hypothetical protein
MEQYERRGRMMGGSPKTPKPPPAPPTVEDPAVEEARRKELEIARRAKGRAATLLATQDAMDAAAPVVRKTLLGQ